MNHQPCCTSAHSPFYDATTSTSLLTSDIRHMRGCRWVWKIKTRQPTSPSHTCITEPEVYSDAPQWTEEQLTLTNQFSCFNFNSALKGVCRRCPLTALLRHVGPLVYHRRGVYTSLSWLWMLSAITPVLLQYTQPTIHFSSQTSANNTMHTEMHRIDGEYHKCFSFSRSKCRQSILRTMQVSTMQRAARLDSAV